GQLEAKVVLTENEKIESFSEQGFQERTQETKWQGLLYLYEKSLNQDQHLFLDFSTKSFNQNYSERGCLKSTRSSLKSDFQFPKNSKSHQRKQSEIKSFFIGNPDLVDAWAKLIDAPDAIRKNIDLLEDVTNWPASWKLTKSGDGMLVSNSTGRQLGTVYSDKIVAPARKVSGETGNALINKTTLIKNMKYDVDGIVYQTDELGRV
ncbi:MAG: hypothetical protein M3421_14325, partial [Bacteroidota bacterium]|nr:hypothetical protein [Bacteroidota bacterium]